MDVVHAEAAGIKVSGVSLAGEETTICLPELDVGFDFGKAPRELISLNTVALSHGHMDHAAGIAYYLSQRHFQDLPPGTVVCDHRLVAPFNDLLDCWGRIEGHRSPANLVGVEPGQSHDVRKGLSLKAFAVNHHGFALGYTLVEHRAKLKAEYLDADGQPRLSGPELVKLKAQGVAITQPFEVPLVCYLGDTGPGDFLALEHVRKAKVLLLECTFFEPEHVRRAKQGRHLHVRDLPGVLDGLENEAILLLHVTRRTPLSFARRTLREVCGGLPIYPRLEFLMDRRRWRDVPPPVLPEAVAGGERSRGE